MTLNLPQLHRIESNIVEDLQVASFTALGHGGFLEYILTESSVRALVEERGGLSLGGEDSGVGVGVSQSQMVSFSVITDFNSAEFHLLSYL